MSSGQFTRLLSAFREGDAGSEAVLIEFVYQDLRRMASKHLRGPRMGTLNTTLLINESYLRLVSPSARHVESRNHFFYLASRVMRQIVVDYARARIREAQHFDREADVQERLEMREASLNDSRWLVRVDEALDDLARENERQARVVECRFFAGMTEEETSLALNASLRTVQREWDRAREWLKEHMAR